MLHMTKASNINLSIQSIQTLWQELLQVLYVGEINIIVASGKYEYVWGIIHQMHYLTWDT